MPSSPSKATESSINTPTNHRRRRCGRGGAPSKLDRQLRSEFVLPPLDPGEGVLATHSPAPSRMIIQAELAAWLRATARFAPGTSVVCSLPDMTEMGMGLEEYEAWWADVADLVFSKLRPGQFFILYQSDSKTWADKARCTGWLSKMGLAMAAARRAGATLLWHKVFTFGPPGAAQPFSVGRPGFSNMVCFGAATPSTATAAAAAAAAADSSCSSDGALRPRHPPTPHRCPHPGYDPKASLSPDVMARGPQLWDRGCGLQAAHVACAFLAAQQQQQQPRGLGEEAAGRQGAGPTPQTPDCPPEAACVRTVVNLCCGVGTLVAMANACGLHAVGVELNAGRCADARRLRLSLPAVLEYRLKCGTLPPTAAKDLLGMNTLAAADAGRSHGSSGHGTSRDGSGGTTQGRAMAAKRGVDGGDSLRKRGAASMATALMRASLAVVALAAVTQIGMRRFCS